MQQNAFTAAFAIAPLPTSGEQPLNELWTDEVDYRNKPSDHPVKKKLQFSRLAEMLRAVGKSARNADDRSKPRIQGHQLQDSIEAAEFIEAKGLAPGVQKAAMSTLAAERASELRVAAHGELFASLDTRVQSVERNILAVVRLSAFSSQRELGGRAAEGPVAEKVFTRAPETLSELLSSIDCLKATAVSAVEELQKQEQRHKLFDIAGELLNTHASWTAQKKVLQEKYGFNEDLSNQFRTFLHPIVGAGTSQETVFHTNTETGEVTREQSCDGTNVLNVDLNSCGKVKSLLEKKMWSLKSSRTLALKDKLTEVGIDFDPNGIYTAADAAERRRLLAEARSKLEAQHNLDAKLRNQLVAKLKALETNEDNNDAAVVALEDELNEVGMYSDHDGIAADAAERCRLVADARSKLMAERDFEPEAGVDTDKRSAFQQRLHDIGGAELVSHIFSKCIEV